MWFTRILKAVSWVRMVLRYLVYALKTLLDGSLAQMIEAWKVISIMPNIENEYAFRNWVRAFPRFAYAIARMTQTTVDDKIVDVVEGAVENDLYWDLFYTILIKIWGDVAKPNNVYHLGTEREMDERISRLADKMGVSPLLVIAVVNFILKLIDLIKNR